MNKKLGNHRTCRVEITDEQGKVLVKGKCINAVLSTDLVRSQAYLELTERDPSMLDIYKFMRTYSADHRRKYPFNAAYKGESFYLADGRDQHSPALQYFERYKVETGNDNFDEFRKVATK